MRSDLRWSVSIGDAEHRSECFGTATGQLLSADSSHVGGNGLFSVDGARVILAAKRLQRHKDLWRYALLRGLG